MNLTRALYTRLVDYSDPDSFASRLRRRRSGPLMALIQRIAAARGQVRIIDIGGSRAYWSALPAGFLDAHHARVTVVNLPGELRDQDDEQFRFLEGDGCALAYPDRSFDLAHSNSVIEHVGRWRDMQAFARELARVADCYYLQTPYFWFPIEPHFMAPFYHWLPEPLRVSVNMRFAMASVKRPDVSRAMQEAVDDLRLLDRKMLQALLPDASIRFERLLLLSKSMIAMRERKLADA